MKDSIAVKKTNFHINKFIGEILDFWDDWQYHILVNDEPIMDLDDDDNSEMESKQIIAGIRKRIIPENEVFFGFSWPFANEPILYVGGEVDYQAKAQELGIEDDFPPIGDTDIFGIYLTVENGCLIFDSAINFGGMESGVSGCEDAIFDPIITDFIESFIKDKKSYKTELAKRRKSQNVKKVQENLSGSIFNGCRNGDLDLVRLAIKHGADVNEKNGEYWALTPLFFAAHKNDFKMVNLLLKSGADVNALTYAGTILDVLMKPKGDPSAYPLDGECSQEMIDYLVAKGAKSTNTGKGNKI